MMTKQHCRRPRVFERLERLTLNAVPRHAAWIAALALVHGCGDVVGPAPTSTSQLSRSMTASAASSIAVDGSQTFYGPEQFVRSTGAPDQVTRVISTFGYAGPFVLHVQSGAADGSSRVTSGSVTLGGVTLLGPSDFNKKAGSWSIPVSLGDSATLEVTLAGKPGSYLTISLEGMVHTRFCPAATGDGFGYQTLQTALDSVAVGHTVWVCDGTHSVNEALVRKALTIRAENPGQATLAQDPAATGTAAVLTVSGISSGTVAISGLTFSYSRIGLRTLDYDSLSVTGTRFAGPAASSIPATSYALGGVLLDLTPTPPSFALFDHDTFTGGVTGLNQQQPVNIVTTNSNFHDTKTFGLIYSTANGAQNPVPAGGTAIMRGGRAEYNTFTNCGLTAGACIALEQSGADTVRFNTINMPSGTVSDGIFVNRIGQTAALTHPAVLTDNFLTGHGPVGDPSIGANWGMFGAIVENGGIPGVVDDMERNQINTAFTGLQLRGFPALNEPVSVSAQDNQIAHTYIAINIRQAFDVLTAHRNDISDYVYPLTSSQPPFAPTAPTLTASALTCNWWGSASGPVNMLPGVLVTAYTPFASTPIAGQPGVSCSP